MEELGSGFYLAMHDLEIRGAGEVLGEEPERRDPGDRLPALQRHAWAERWRALRERPRARPRGPVHARTEIELHVPALIPDDYLPDVHMRLVLYKRIANAATRAQLDELQVEIIDRFGLLPPPLKTLFAITWLKLLAQRLGVAKIQAGAEGGSVRFARARERRSGEAHRADRERQATLPARRAVQAAILLARREPPSNASARSRSC